MSELLTGLGFTIAVSFNIAAITLITVGIIQFLEAVFSAGQESARRSAWKRPLSEHAIAGEVGARRRHR